tara:strand:+ start:5739 stop:6125 length:387 start_codon:yes stop_codon:yes gene_type:complete
MNSTNVGMLRLIGLQVSCISLMTYFLYDNKETAVNEDKADILLTKPIIGTTYISPHIRSYGSTYYKPLSVNETIAPAINNNYKDECNFKIISNLDEIVYNDNRPNIVSYIKSYKSITDKYDKFLYLFE